MAKKRLLFFLIFGFFYNISFAIDNLSITNKFANQFKFSEKERENLKIDNNSEYFKKLSNMNMLGDNSSVKKQITKIEEVIKNTDIKSIIKNYSKELEIKDYEKKLEENACQSEEDLGDNKFFVFISESMPKETLKKYADDLKRLKTGYMILNGTVGDPKSFKPTINFILEFACGITMNDLTTENKCNDIPRVDINPLLFRIFRIDKVPAFVYSDLSYLALMGMAEKNKINEEDYVVLYGDVSVDYAIDKISKHKPQILFPLKERRENE